MWGERCVRRFAFSMVMDTLSLFPAAHQPALAGLRVAQGDPGEDLFQGIHPSLDEFAGVIRTHGEHPDVEKEFHDRVPGDFVFHEQHDPVRTHHPLHFQQGLLPGFPLQFIEGMGTGHRVEAVVRERKKCRVPFHETDPAGDVLFHGLVQHAAGKIVTHRHGFGISPVECQGHRSRSAADIQDAGRGLVFQEGGIDEEFPGVVLIPPGMHADEGVVETGEEIVIPAPSLSRVRHVRFLSSCTRSFPREHRSRKDPISPRKWRLFARGLRSVRASIPWVAFFLHHHLFGYCLPGRILLHRIATRNSVKTPTPTGCRSENIPAWWYTMMSGFAPAGG